MNFPAFFSPEDFHFHRFRLPRGVGIQQYVSSLEFTSNTFIPIRNNSASGFGLGQAFLHRALGLLSGFFKFTKLAYQKITFSRHVLAEFRAFYSVFSQKKTLFDICQVGM